MEIVKQIQVPHQDFYSIESYRFINSEREERRVFYEGNLFDHGWYYFKGTLKGLLGTTYIVDREPGSGKFSFSDPTDPILLDTLEKIPEEVLKREWDEEDAEEAKKIEEKGHDCQDFICHGMYDRGNGSLNDYYYCGKCNDLLQTG